VHEGLFWIIAGILRGLLLLLEGVWNFLCALGESGGGELLMNIGEGLYKGGRWLIRELRGDHDPALPGSDR